MRLFQTFKSCVAKVFSSPAFDVFNSINDDGTPQDMSQTEDMKLFKRCTGLRSKIEKSWKFELKVKHVLGEEKVRFYKTA
jgi:hypothetical protein